MVDNISAPDEIGILISLPAVRRAPLDAGGDIRAVPAEQRVNSGYFPAKRFPLGGDMSAQEPRYSGNEYSHDPLPYSTPALTTSGAEVNVAILITDEAT